MITFELLPLLDRMIAFYSTPVVSGRFNHYLELLLSPKEELQLPIGDFNPMGKAHILTKLLGLKA